MKYEWDSRIDLHVKDRISREHADRQQHTATEILRRLRDQPGVILADEVGMGKTFVALGAAMSVALSDPENRPVVVMVPPSLKEKWPTDFAVFRDFCLPLKLRGHIRHASADHAIGFLKLLDDPASRKVQIVFLTHGAMNRSMGDPWVMLAIICQAIKGRRGVEAVRSNLARHVGALLRMEKVDPEAWKEFLRRPPEDWLHIMNRYRVASVDGDDPVPEAVRNALPYLEMESLYETIQALPRRHSEHYVQRIRDARKELKAKMRTLWKTALQRLHIKLPLLILDEAHHLKNSQTRLASLFQSEEAIDDAEEFTKGTLAGAFERMLFLTATPFQLGHRELCSVLERFEAVNWHGTSAPKMGRQAFRETVGSLKDALDRSQEAAVMLDSAWGRLTHEDLLSNSISYQSPESWWPAIGESAQLSPNGSQVFLCYKRTSETMKAAEQLIRPWVLRHLMPRSLPDPHGAVLRRRRLVGSAIIDVSPSNSDAGLAVSDENLLPFLLAARATASSPAARPVFAEGLASSYEAFLHTRSQRLKHAGESVEAFIEDEEKSAADAVPVTEETRWYLDSLEELVPRDKLAGSRSHPKVAATVERAIALWKSGEKVLIFCHYVATGRILRQHLSDAVETEITALGARKLSCPTGEVGNELERIGARFFDVDAPLRRACDLEIGNILEDFPALENDRDVLLEVARRNIRTPSFLVRFFPLESMNLDGTAMEDALNRHDGSGQSLRTLLHRFFDFLAKRTEDERRRYIEAVKRVQTGTHLGAEVAHSFSPDELIAGQAERLLPNVRLVNGTVRQETRQRLMLTFNTPFYPEILIASSVMAEGVDLHLNCRHVIHHDLCWNPSMLEQRTGRVDRIGAKAEHCGKPIHVYMPYVAETQDEKMYRVVTDRERWFNVVMGEEYKLDASTTDRLAERISLPTALAEALSFDLTVEGHDRHGGVASGGVD